jgi:hypothetical protein
MSARCRKIGVVESGGSAFAEGQETSALLNQHVLTLLHRLLEAIRRHATSRSQPTARLSINFEDCFSLQDDAGSGKDRTLRIRNSLAAAANPPIRDLRSRGRLLQGRSWSVDTDLLIILCTHFAMKFDLATTSFKQAVSYFAMLGATCAN